VRLIFRFASAGALVLAMSAGASGQTRPPMPDFKAKTMNGESLTRDSLKGKPYLLQFWTTWCNYCRSDQPAVEQFIREKGRQIPVICVNVEESRETVTKYLATAPRSCKVVLTEDTNLTRIVKPKGFPKYVLVDAKGTIGSIQDGAGGMDALRETLAEAGLK
jgi:thiol-disulfide isomerase/thioredoxin